MFARIFKCVLLPGNNIIQEVNNTNLSVDNLPSSKKLVTLRLIYSSLNNKFNKKNGLLSTNEGKIEYYYSTLNDILVSLNRSKDLSFKIKESLVSVLISIAKVSNNVEINGKINEFIQGLILSVHEQEIVKLLKHFIKSKYNVYNTKLLNRICSSDNVESDVYFDLYWCLSTLGVEFSKLCVLLEKIIAQVERTNIVNNLKLLNSLHGLFCKVNSERVKNNIIMSTQINGSEEPTTIVTQQLLLDKINLYRSTNYDHDDQKLSEESEKKLLNETIEYVKICLLNKIDEFDNSRDRRDVAIEGLIQLVWSLQSNNVYPSKLLQMLISEFDTMLEASIGMGDHGKGSKTLNIRQISLFLYSLAYYNMLDIDISMKSLRYLKDYSNKHSNKNMSGDVLNQINILWAICISNVNGLKRIHKDVVECLNNIDWDLFAIKSQFEDLRKVMQIIAILKLECSPNDLNIPDNVVKMVETSGNTSVDYRVTSVTQDKVRRVLQSKGLDFKSEYEINSQISVDFIVFAPKDVTNNLQNAYDLNLNDSNCTTYSSQDERPKGLVIEIDGPFHYNLLLDPGSSGVYDKGNEISFGNLKLTLNGKTIYRNEILKRLGYSIVSIPWFVGYQKSFYHTIENILSRHFAI
ncbi:hypothetical protein MACK_000320 [Theileria orientalis]|uniref:RAP domain-containing protein n=1 Tax=Theileria orientalis TaxID=68886 RepID=A0A976M9Q0_THEOR|nr:hypothetical protein MACK_000320 [Theileria orientalis]